MASPPAPSLASILAMPGDPHQQHLVVDGSHDDADLLNYLKETYASAEDVNLDTMPNTKPRQPTTLQPPQLQHRLQSMSPPDQTLRIDPALAELASQAPSDAAPEVPAPSFWLPGSQGDYGALGEMGGKRKKLPHERAGWKEMDEAGAKKRGGPRKAQDVPVNNIQQDESGPSNGINGAGMLERDLLEAHRQNGGGLGDDRGEMYGQMGLYPPASSGGEFTALPDGQEADETSGGEEGTKRKRNSDEAKEARAEQNRRAQQAFRRRREEKMKGLEAAAAALEPTQRRLMEVESKWKDASLSLEAAKIECMAYQSALRTLAQTSGQSILTVEGTLAINTIVQRKRGPSDAREIEEASAVLSRQARELAKQNKSKRGY